MSRPKPWLKLWTEWIHDPKILSLTLAESGAWCKVLTLAQELQADGDLVRGSGNPLSLEEIATCLHLNNGDMPILSSMFAKMQSEGSISNEDGIFTLVNFQERQSLIPSETKEAVRERVRRYRERLVTKKSLQEKESTKEKDINVTDKDKDKECNGEKAVTYLEHSNVTGNVTNNVTKKPLQSIKKAYGLGNNVLISEEEHEKLLEKFGGPGVLERIDKLSAYIGSTGKKYKNHYMTILNWEMRGKDNARTGTNRQQLPTSYTTPEEWKRKHGGGNNGTTGRDVSNLQGGAVRPPGSPIGSD